MNNPRSCGASMRRCVHFAVLACVASLSGAALSAPAKPQRWSGRPQLQYNANSTSSWMQKTTAPPAGTSLHVLEFDYLVDSEPGYDMLKVWQGGVLLWSTSGAKAGHQKLNLSNSASTIKFEYYKDISLMAGRDVAMVDNVRLTADGVLYDWSTFDGWAGSLPAGWTAGGTGGGAAGFSTAIPAVQRSVARSAAQYHTDNTSSWMSRTVTFASAVGSSVTFNYLVDSETNYDFLKVWDGPTLVFSTSGSAKSGTGTFPITTAGNHVLKFEYFKDGSVSVGRDTARITSVQLKSGYKVFESHDFAGLAEGATPSGWTTGGTFAGYGMFVAKTSPHDSYVSRQTFTADPLIDGLLEKPEYGKNSTTITLRNDGSPWADQGKLVLAESNATNKLFVAAILESEDDATGNESGTFTLYFDAERGSTLSDLGCAGNVHSPGASDRRITFGYSSGPGAESSVISATTQVKGNCTGGYVALGAEPLWPMSIAVREPEGRGKLILEMSVTIPSTSPILSESLLGFGFKHQSTSGTHVERFPYRDDASFLPVDSEVYSLETIRLSSVPALGPLLTENGWDGCCMSVQDRHEW